MNKELRALKRENRKLRKQNEYLTHRIDMLSGAKQGGAQAQIHKKMRLQSASGFWAYNLLRIKSTAAYAIYDKAMFTLRKYVFASNLILIAKYIIAIVHGSVALVVRHPARAGTYDAFGFSRRSYTATQMEYIFPRISSRQKSLSLLPYPPRQERKILSRYGNGSRRKRRDTRRQRLALHGKGCLRFAFSLLRQYLLYLLWLLFHAEKAPALSRYRNGGADILIKNDCNKEEKAYGQLHIRQKRLGKERASL